MSSPLSKRELLLVGVSAVVGAVVTATATALRLRHQALRRGRHDKAPPPPALDKERDTAGAHALVWGAISGAMQASQLYLGDKLQLYSALARLCATEGTSTTAIELARATGLHVRWLREWMAQQAAMGVLVLQPGTGDDDEDLRYRLPSAYQTVLSDPTSDEYDIAMVQLVPSLVHRAKVSLPEAFRTGLGRTYDERDISESIDRQHKVQIRKTVLPIVIPSAKKGATARLLSEGATVGELGCGGANFLLAMATAYPRSVFHGFEVSDEALGVAAQNVAESGLTNVFLHDAKEAGESIADFSFDVVTTFDVLHDAPHPTDLIGQVRRALKPGGVWYLADIASAHGVRANLAENPAAATMLAFSTCLCMACAMSTPDGEGLGTLGFSIPVAKRMLGEAGFTDIEVVSEADNTRWYVVVAPAE